MYVTKLTRALGKTVVHETFKQLGCQCALHDVEVATLQGRGIERLSTMVVNQLKKSIRTKHTLPAYKDRLIITDLDLHKRELLHMEMSKGREPKAIVSV